MAYIQRDSEKFREKTTRNSERNTGTGTTWKLSQKQLLYFVLSGVHLHMDGDMVAMDRTWTWSYGHGHHGHGRYGQHGHGHMKTDMNVDIDMDMDINMSSWKWTWILTWTLT